MLERSRDNLESASSFELRVSEIVALRYLTAELEENLIPAEDAERVANAHRASADETWSRAVHAVLMGLRKAKQLGFTITEASPVA